MAGLVTPDVALADAAGDAAKFIADHEKNVKPLEVLAGLAWWDVNISGKDEDFKKKENAQNEIDAALSNQPAFAKLKAMKEAGDKGELKDPLVTRQIDLLYLAYLEKQVDPDLLKRITAKSNSVEQQFNVFRAKVDGKEMADSEVRSVLKNSNDSAVRQKIWEASKGVGKAVEADLKELVGLRNDAAKKLNFPNFHAMMLTLNEQKGDELIKLFDELDALTKEPFKLAKTDKVACKAVLVNLAEALRVVAILTKPFLPKTSETFYRAFNFAATRPWDAVSYDDALARPDGPDLEVTAILTNGKPQPLFPKFDIKAAI